MAEHLEFRLPGSNVTYVGAIPPLQDYIVRVARMVEAFTTKGSDDLQDIRTADVISAIGDLYGRAKEFERGCTLGERRASERGTGEGE